jgi:hypothetical protein
MELDAATLTKDAGLVNAKPLHPLRERPDAMIVASGKPMESTLLERIRRRPPQTGAMPPLSTHAVDERAVKLIEEWIRNLPTDAKK